MRKFLVSASCLLFINVGQSLAADVNSDQALNSCRSMSNDAERLACYDAITSNAPVASRSSSTEALDKLGAEQLPRTDEQMAEENPTVTAYVTRCTKASNKKYVFYLESGQVWRQKSDKRLYFKDCQFQVEINKDFFGYKMNKVGESSRFRVSRVR